MPAYPVLLPPGSAVPILPPAAAPARPRAARRASWFPKWKFNWCGPVVCLLLVLIGAGWFSGPVATSLLSSLAAVSGDVAKISNSGANVTVALTEAALSIGRTSANLAAEAWNGIDLFDVKATVQHSKWVMHGSLCSQNFLDSSIGQKLAPFAATGPLLASLRAVSPALPSIINQSVVWVANGSFVEVSSAVVYLDFQYVGVEILYTNLTFEVQWCNPLWEWLASDPTTQSETLQRKVRSALRDVQAAEWKPTPFSHYADLIVLRPTALEDLLWRARVWWAGPQQFH